MKTIEQVAAEILVECGYAKSFSNEQWLIMDGIGNKYNGLPYEQAVTPFADTLEGRRQLDALFFYALFPDKSITFTGDGHFSPREEMIGYVEEYLNEYTTR